MDRRAPDPGPRAAWAFAMVGLVLGLGFIVFIAFEGTGRRIGSAPVASRSTMPNSTTIADFAPMPIGTAWRRTSSGESTTSTSGRTWGR